MIRTTVGQLLLNEALPEPLRGEHNLDKAGTKKLLKRLAQEHPEHYRDTLHKLHQAAHKAAYLTGAGSFGLQDLATPPEVKKLRDELEKKVHDIRMRDDLTSAERKEKILQVVDSYSKPLEQSAFESSVKNNSKLAQQVVSGSRGNKTNLRSLLAGDLLYVDHHDDLLSIPVTRSYSEGLTPVQYYASTFGARKGVADVKFGVRDAGYSSKQFNQATHRLLVTAHDGPSAGEHRGLPVDTNDPHNAGAALAQPIGPYKRNTILTPNILQDLHDKGHTRILVRSPLVGGPPQGGVYGMDVGVREKGRVAPVGDFVGLAAAQSLSEPLTQAQLCLAAGTEVRMADNTIKKIEDICVGDMVLGSDKNGHTFPVRVVRTYDNGVRHVWETVFRRFSNESSANDILQLVATPEHKLLCWSADTDENHLMRPTVSAVSDLAKPDSLYAVLVGGLGGISGQSNAGEQPTYDIEVDHPDHLFVLANGLIVSNSSKHSGGVAGAGSLSGFKLIDAMVQVPKTFPGGATHAQKDGTVTSIEPAPQGGMYVHIDGHSHHIRVGQKPLVARGDKIEAGDLLSDGTPNPAEIVQHKGIGEGRRHFAHALRKVYTASGMPDHRRNIELLTRGLIDHVNLNEEYGDYLPDDIVSYSNLESTWQPRKETKRLKPEQALNHYLEAPVLHYSIGTQVKPSVVKELQHFGVPHVDAHPEPPPFEPIMVRGLENLTHDRDWMARFYGSYVKSNFIKGVQRGDSSNELGTSFVPSLASGLNFNSPKSLARGYETSQ